MNVLFMLLGVLIVYIIVKQVFRHNWNKELSVDVRFDKKHAVKDETIYLTEIVTNAKVLPLPCVNLKFQIGRELQFTDADTNSSVSDKVYRNDVFSFLSNQRITRRIPLKCTKRGVFRISGLEITFSGPFMNEINVIKYDNDCQITVYPKVADMKQLRAVNTRVTGEVQRRKYLMDDPFVFRGIRDYTSNDSLKNVNWKATGKTGSLMVNEYDESVSRNVCILLNLEEDGALRYDTIDEEAISIAAGLSEILISQGINVSMICNGCDTDTKEQTIVRKGAGAGHLNYINTALARIDTHIYMEEYADTLMKRVEDCVDSDFTDCIYVMISSSRRKKLQMIISRIIQEPQSFVWIVPHLPGCEYTLDSCNVEPVGWSVN